MFLSNKKQIGFYLKIIIILGLLALVFLCFLLIIEYKYVRQLDYVSMRKALLLKNINQPLPVTPVDVQFIQLWMTFDYINHTFNLPAEYIKASLSINDDRYPNLSLSKYSRDAHIDKLTFLNQIKVKVEGYLIQK